MQSDIKPFHGNRLFFVLEQKDMPQKVMEKFIIYILKVV